MSAYDEDPTENLKLLTAILQDLQRQGIDWYPNDSSFSIDFMRLGRTVGHVYHDEYLETRLTT